MGYRWKKYVSIFLHMQKLNIMRRAAYPLSFLSVIGTVLLVMFFSLVFFTISFRYMDSLAGWSLQQIASVLGTYMILEGLIWGLCAQLNHINMHIRQGTLDGILLKPIDDQFLATFWRGDAEDLSRIVTGVAMLIYSAANTVGFSLWRTLLYVVVLACGAVSLYSFNLAVRSMSFWIIDGSGLWLLMERVTGNAKYPTDIYYHKTARALFTFVIPLAFMTTIPARVWTSAALDPLIVSESVIAATCLFFGSRRIWKFSLKRYSSASS